MSYVTLMDLRQGSRKRGRLVGSIGEIVAGPTFDRAAITRILSTVVTRPTDCPSGSSLVEVNDERGCLPRRPVPASGYWCDQFECATDPACPEGTTRIAQQWTAGRVVCLSPSTAKNQALIQQTLDKRAELARLRESTKTARDPDRAKPLASPVAPSGSVMIVGALGLAVLTAIGVVLTRNS